ncbi:MAG: hypothetical protein A2078_00780 [Nitrospirae bacterium GWC2_57_9]|nr:MAG: hypothetical protein A2078_00780 [Nitrospirae bacterium GWC2_57_9]
MDKLMRLVVAAVFGIVVIGCSATAKKMTIESRTERTDVFKEVTGGDPIPTGYGDVVIRGNIKTHLGGYYIGESKESVHGKESYPFLVNIDGQAALWSVPGVRDSKPAYDKDGKTSRDPEAREGMKYILEKKIRLAAGSHKVFFGLPADNYFIEADITVQNGETTVIEYKPVYRYKTMPTRIPTFLKGFSRYEIYLNGNKS